MIRQALIICGVTVFLSLISFTADAHRSGCHRWHSCPSDHGTYVCGDTGHCSQCPDNKFCKDGKPRSQKEPGSKQKSDALTNLIVAKAYYTSTWQEVKIGVLHPKLTLHSPLTHQSIRNIKLRGIKTIKNITGRYRRDWKVDQPWMQINNQNT